LAKNLKLNIKNTQIAKALNLGSVKEKLALKKAGAEEDELADTIVKKGKATEQASQDEQPKEEPPRTKARSRSVFAEPKKKPTEEEAAASEEEDTSTILEEHTHHDAEEKPVEAAPHEIKAETPSVKPVEAETPHEEPSAMPPPSKEPQPTVIEKKEPENRFWKSIASSS